MERSRDGARSTIEAGELKALLYRSRRRTLSIQLRPDRELVMRAPYGVPETALRDFLERRKAWVLRQRARLESLASSCPGTLWAAGELLPYLGRELELRVERGGAGRARMEGDAIVARVADPLEVELVRRAVERLYAREAARALPAYLEECLELPAAVGLPRPSLRFRCMRSRWGSCDTVRRIVTLNTRLVRQSPELVRYVILHELAHLRHRGHDEAFYRFLGELCPGWELLRARLSARRPE
jgi:predicted metal-dependent hydrolase